MHAQPHVRMANRMRTGMATHAHVCKKHSSSYDPMLMHGHMCVHAQARRYALARARAHTHTRTHTHTHTHLHTGLHVLVHAQLISALKEFRLMSMAARAAANRLALPTPLRLLPLWLLCLMKSPALKGGAKVGG